MGVIVAMTIKRPAVGTIAMAFLLLLAPAGMAEVLLAKDETLLALSPSVDVIAFSNYTTNNPLDNLKDFPDTWHEEHEFSLTQNPEDGHDQLAVESREGGHHLGGEGGQQGVQVSTTASFSEAVQVVRVTIPGLAPTLPPAYTSLYQTAEWSEQDSEEEVDEEEVEVEDEDAAYQNRLEELQRKY